MNLRKKFILIVLTIVLCFILSSIVYAEDFEMKITANSDTIKPGETIVANVSTENLQTTNNSGVNVFVLTLNYDRNIFEEVNENDISLLNNWSGLTFNKENGKILINKFEKVEANETLFEVKLKAKEDIELKDTQIKIEDANYASSGEDLHGDIGTLNLKINKISKTFITVGIIGLGIISLVVGLIIGFLFSKNKKKEEEVNELEEK